MKEIRRIAFGLILSVPMMWIGCGDNSGENNTSAGSAGSAGSTAGAGGSAAGAGGSAAGAGGSAAGAGSSTAGAGGSTTAGAGGSTAGAGGSTAGAGGSAAGAGGSAAGAGGSAAGAGGSAAGAGGSTAGAGGSAAGAGGSAAGAGGNAGGGETSSSPSIAGCPVFPKDNEWNRDISGDPIDPKSDDYITFINSNGGTQVHPDFGSNPEYGIPYVVVDQNQPVVGITFDYKDESDPGPYPIPSDAPIEGGPNPGGDRHILVIQKGACKLYEIFDAHYVGPGWTAGSGAIFDLNSNSLRPDGWTSADAAGLPIFPGLVRYEEAVTMGEIRHALRFTVHKTQAAYIHPATHFASKETNPNAPPMGLRLRMKANYDISGFTGAAKVIAIALKKYGMFVADNGSNWFISGASNSGFDDDELDQLKGVPGTAFEVVKSPNPIQK